MIYQYNKTAGQSKEDKVKEVKRPFSSHVRMNEYLLKNSQSPFPLKMNDNMDHRWRSIERKSPELRSRKNLSLNRDFVSYKEYISKKNGLNSERSYSMPRNNDQRASKTETLKDCNSIQYSDNISRYLVQYFVVQSRCLSFCQVLR